MSEEVKRCRKCGAELFVGVNQSRGREKARRYICSSCVSKASREYVNKRKQEITTDRPSGRCKTCGELLVVGKNWGLSAASRGNKTCKHCDVLRVTRQNHSNRERCMLRGARSRAKQRGTRFDIDETDIIIPKCCPVLGTALVWSSGSGFKNDVPSLDAVDPKLGYVKGNVCVISGRANKLKSDASLEELNKITDYIRSFGAAKASSQEYDLNASSTG